MTVLDQIVYVLESAVYATIAGTVTFFLVREVLHK
jgi:hypothetical protein